MNAHARFGFLALGLALIGSAMTAATTVSAQSSVDRVQFLMEEALETDYLSTEFTAADGKLKAAIAVCVKAKASDDACPDKILAEAYRARGIVLAGGLANHKEAVEAFREMLVVDATFPLHDDYTTDEIQAAYDEAKKWTERGIPPGLQGLDETPWTEQAVGRPIPVFVKVPEGVNVAKIVVRFKSPGSDKWRDVTLQEQGEGFGGYVPCRGVGKEGELLYFVTGVDTSLVRVAVAGTEETPRVVELKVAIEGRQPSLPDTNPPSACPAARLDMMSCEIDDDCPGNQICDEYYCIEGERPPSAEEAAAEETIRNWFSLTLSPDVVLLQSTTDACSPTAQSSGQLGCYYDEGIPYRGNPDNNGKTNLISGGFGFGSARALFGYDRVLGTNMTAGIRAGIAFLGSPEHSNGDNFFPFHAAGRFAYYFTRDPFRSTGVRPFAYVTAGTAQTVGLVRNDIRETLPNNKVVDARVNTYQRSGNYFAGGGIGAQYAISKEAAMVLDVGAWQMFPEQTTVISPQLGFAYGL